MNSVTPQALIIEDKIAKLLNLLKKGYTPPLSYVSCFDNRFWPSVAEFSKFILAAAT